ncbi:MAG: NAD-dependent epimerase/dehydratase family protein [Flavobacteriales bacterium]|jgi:2-alkyl-3-oxoalkanoate reductase|nr:NAD-dependent epimerase/dehydratase family protein [Flavobacteriales bacterium]
MKILITGATGFLGSRLLERLASSESDAMEVIAVGRTLKPNNTVEASNIRYQLGDLEEEAFVKDAIRGADVVVHAAALSAQMGPEGAFKRANVQVTQHVVNACETHSVKRLIYISSPSVYFQFKDQLNINENDALPTPINGYAKTKREAECLVMASEVPHIIFRPRALIGRGDTVIIPRVIRAHSAGRLRRMGLEQNRADLTPVSNVVDAILLATRAEGDALNQIYNISNGQPEPLWPLLDRVFSELEFEAVSKRIPISLAVAAARLMEWHAIYLNGRKEPALTVYGIGTLTKDFGMDISKAKKLLGYEPRQTVKDAIDEFLNWYKAQPV